MFWRFGGKNHNNVNKSVHLPTSDFGLLTLKSAFHPYMFFLLILKKQPFLCCQVIYLYF